MKSEVCLLLLLFSMIILDCTTDVNGRDWGRRRRRRLTYVPRTVEKRAVSNEAPFAILPSSLVINILFNISYILIPVLKAH